MWSGVTQNILFRKLRFALYLKIFVKGKENRTLKLDNKLVDIKTSMYQRIIWRFFKMQVKMNLMHRKLVLIKKYWQIASIYWMVAMAQSIVLSTLHGCSLVTHFLRQTATYWKTSYLHLSPLAIGTNVNLKIFSDLIWMSGCEMEKKDKNNSWQITLKVWVLMNCTILHENSGFIQWCAGKYLTVDSLGGKALIW